MPVTGIKETGVLNESKRKEKKIKKPDKELRYNINKKVFQIPEDFFVI